MAQVIERYRATAGGNSCMYYYRYADNTSAATRIYTGEVIYLHADYQNRITNGMYLMVSPSGWIPWYHVQNVEAVYVTVTDKCTPPSKVTLNAANKTLLITGGGGGDLNAFSGFGVSWRERAVSSTAWNEWSADSIVTGRTVNISAGSGMVRQYRVRTCGEAGSAYYSAYTLCDQMLNGNTAAGTPVVILPLSGMETGSAAVSVRIDCPAEPDGDAMTLQRSLDSGAWTKAASLSGAGGTVYDRVAISEGAHTLRYRLMDAGGEVGGEDSIGFVRTAPKWARTINQGDVIANGEISFVNDIRELHERVNSLRAFYGAGALELPGTPGRIGDWQRQLSAMQQGVNDCRLAMGLQAVSFSADAWPRAEQINLLRTTIENT